MPKCSGPTCWTRGWKVPRGLCRTSVRRDRERRQVVVADMGTHLQKEIGRIPILLDGGPECVFFLEKQHMAHRKSCATYYGGSNAEKRRGIEHLECCRTNAVGHTRGQAR